LSKDYEDLQGKLLNTWMYVVKRKWTSWSNELERVLLVQGSVLFDLLLLFSGIAACGGVIKRVRIESLTIFCVLVP
jgi:hypothetical protein